MRCYSFKVIALGPVAIENPVVFLGRGLNVFTVMVDDDCRELMDRLSAENVRVLESNLLEQEALTPEEVAASLDGGYNLEIPRPLPEKQ